ncbi:MAG: hypothetical protein WCK49_02235 [Myxococcaceae bacterium]
MHKIFISSLFLATALLSTEIDSFTQRDPYMEDSLAELNQMAQTYFDEAIVKANAAGSCERSTFEDAFHSITTGGAIFWDRIELDIEKSDTMDRRTLAKKDSIYRDINFIEGPILQVGQLGFLLRIGDLYIGSDKFGHFYDTGYEYYKKSSLEDAMSYGEMTERTYFGLTSTAVYSYADLAANLDGYRFWTRLTQGKDAYAMCENNIWKQQNSFTWTDHISAAWDEGYNCNSYRNDHVTYSVATRIIALGFNCPVPLGRCLEMIDRYEELSSHVVTAQCF